MNAYEGALKQAGVYRTDIRQQQGWSGEGHDAAHSSGAVYDAQWNTSDSRSLNQGQALSNAPLHGQHSQASLTSSYPMTISDNTTPGNTTSNSWPTNAQAQAGVNAALSSALHAQIHAAALANAGWTQLNKTSQDNSSNNLVCFVSSNSMTAIVYAP